MKAHELLSGLGLPGRDLYDLPDSEKRFPDGAQYRVEIPSVEGPWVLEAVIAEAERRGVQIHRVSQGSGIMLLTDAEILEMCDMAREAALELSLFVGPRASWGDRRDRPSRVRARSSVPSTAARTSSPTPSKTCCAASPWGLRGVLVADAGLLWVLKRPKGKRRIARGSRPQGLRAAGGRQRGGREDDAGSRGGHIQRAHGPVDGPTRRDTRGGGSSIRRLRRGSRRLRRVREALRDPRPRKGRLTRLRQVRPQERAEHLPERDTPGGDCYCARERKGQTGQDRAGDAKSVTIQRPRPHPRARPSLACQWRPRRRRRHEDHTRRHLRRRHQVAQPDHHPRPHGRGTHGPRRSADGQPHGRASRVPRRGGPEAPHRARPVRDRGAGKGRWAATTSRAPARS